MSVWRVCGKWDLTVDLERPPNSTGHRPFHEFPIADIGKHILCREQLLASLQPLRTVRELFGGLGLTATVVRGQHHPAWHRITEIHPDLVEHLRRNEFDAAQENAFAAVGRLDKRWDLVDADFGLFTVLQWHRDPKLQRFMKELFRGGHSYVMITDECVARLGANRDKYAWVLDAFIENLEDYVNAWSGEFDSLYGYSMEQAVYYRGAVTTLWRQGPRMHVHPVRCEATYPGVEVL